MATKQPARNALRAAELIDGTFVRSFGVACVKRNPSTGCYEVLMIKKKYTYAFVEFVRGLYDAYKDVDVSYMFEQMTITEKTLIQTRNFTTIWNYCNGEPLKSGEKLLFARASRKFETLLGRDRDIIARLMYKTKNADLLWEIPKGRANKKETPLMSATREFEEETGLKKQDYLLLFDEGTIEYSFIDCGVRYKYIYYLALIDGNATLTYDYTNEHMLREVSELKFLSSAATQELNNQRLSKLVRIIIKKSKKHL